MDPSTASCQSQQQQSDSQSGDSGSDGHLANSRNDKDDRGPRYVLYSTAPKPPRRVRGDSPLTPAQGTATEPAQLVLEQGRTSNTSLRE